MRWMRRVGGRGGVMVLARALAPRGMHGTAQRNQSFLDARGIVFQVPLMHERLLDRHAGEETALLEETM